MHAELDVAPEAAIGRVRTEEVLPVQLAGLPDTSTFPGAERRIAMDAHGATPSVNASAVDPSHHLHVGPAPWAGMSACRRREHQSCSYDADGSPQNQPSEQKSHGVPQATSADPSIPQGRIAETIETCHPRLVASSAPAPPCGTGSLTRRPRFFSSRLTLATATALCLRLESSRFHRNTLRPREAPERRLTSLLPIRCPNATKTARGGTRDRGASTSRFAGGTSTTRHSATFPAQPLKMSGGQEVPGSNPGTPTA